MIRESVEEMFALKLNDSYVNIYSLYKFNIFGDVHSIRETLLI